MKRKLIAVSLITVLLCMVLLNTIACAPGSPRTHYNFAVVVAVGGRVAYEGGTGSESGTCTITSILGTTFPDGKVVEIMAIPDEGFLFLSWTGDVDTIVDVNAATTTITMSGNYTIVAHFAKEIRDWHDLNAIRDTRCVVDYILMNDLDSTTAGYEELAGPNANGGKGWEPIGTVATGVDPIPWQWYYPFEGALDGQGHEVRDLFIDRPEESHIGLFGYIRKGVITDVGVVNANVTGLHCVGGLLGWNEHGTLNNSYATGSVNGNGRVGGLVGDNWGLVSNCYATTDVAGESSVGGLVGRNSGTVSNSYSAGNVTAESAVGGLVGYNEVGTVSNSFWDTQTSGQSWSDGGTGKNTTEMQDVSTFTDTATEGLDDPWDIIAVANPGERNAAYIWNIVDGVTYPFLSWEP